MPGRAGPLFSCGRGSDASPGPEMDLPAVLASPTARGGQHGSGPGRLRRGAGMSLSASPGRRRLLLLRGPEDGGPGPRLEEAAGPSPSPPEDGGDAFVVLLEVPRAAEAPGQQEAEPGSDSSPAGHPVQSLAASSGAALAGTVTINNQDLLVHFDHGVFTLAAAPAAQGLRPAATPGPEPSSAAAARRGPVTASASSPGYRCPEPQCALTFAKKHQLKVHLLTHGGLQGRRPFKCPLDGCGWAFTTSYKLKRHLQSHDKLRPFGCQVSGCGKKFTTVYNLKAHMKGHEQESLFKCEVCAERFPTHAKLNSHQRSHFEPERPYKCDFPGCEKTFITVSALFSHNRAHFREQELFSCSFPGCNKQYDKACRLKIHLRSHTGERPFICDSDSCGWTFTSMSKLLRHKRKHDDDRRFTCPVEGCGKSFTRAEHLKGHSITHLGTKPFECPVEGCCARFSARSSLYIHSKKHLQDVGAPKSRCPVSSCNRLFTSKHSMKAHMVRQHSRRQDLVPQLEAPSSLTPSSELSSPGQSELTNIDLAALFSETPANSSSSTGGSDETLNSGILTIDVTSVSSSLGGNLPANNSLGPMDPLVLVAHGDIPPSLDGPLVLGTSAAVLQQGSFSADDTQAMSSGTVDCLVALPVRNLGQDPPALTPSSNFTAPDTTVPDTTLTSSSTSQEPTSVSELLAPIKVEQDLPPIPDVVQGQEESQGLPQSVLSSPAERPGTQKDSELSAGNLYLESGGSARTDYRAIQLVKKIKQKGTGSDAGDSESAHRKMKGDTVSPPHSGHTGQQSCLCGNPSVPSGSLPAPAPETGVQCIQIPVLQPVSLHLCKPLPLLGLTYQDDPSGEGSLPLALSPQPSAFHPYFTVDLPVYVLQEVLPAPASSVGSEAVQVPGSTINLQDLQ
ncbi:zinc finger protein ZXDC isoform X2 [Nannospalax galili]|uniref:zinc finger protein ZXDC isoform X2 n=1 Tax=Nannospalax galili TaxID=1026970 RepID=UPI0004ED5666|nr:zinc finger protein ZXDC isoform X2 [Nannospalax galili]